MRVALVLIVLTGCAPAPASPRFRARPLPGSVRIAAVLDIEKVVATSTAALLVGRVTDAAGKPVDGALVYVTSSSGHEPVVTTDKGGRYRVKLEVSGAHSVAFEFGSARAEQTIIVADGETATLDGQVPIDLGEVIVIHDPPKKPVMPRPLKDPAILPPYSDEAILTE